VDSPVAGAGAPINFLHSGGGVGEQKFYRVAVNP
jgi:hypothetical protein